MPVLSEQITVTEPRDSTAGSFLISDFRLSILWAPIAKVMVTTAGNPSGITATATLIPASSSKTIDSPLRIPRIIIMTDMSIPNRARALPSLSSRLCNGVGSCFTACRIEAILPSSVFIPVETTTALPLPCVTIVPMNIELHLSARAVSSVQIMPASFSTGSDSPVNADS